MTVVVTNSKSIEQYILSAARKLFPANMPTVTRWQVGQPRPTESPDLVILDDPLVQPETLALLENKGEATWVLVRLGQPLATLAADREYQRMTELCGDQRLLILADARQLRHSGSRLRLDGPWEATAQDVVREIAGLPYLFKVTHFVASIGNAGAVSFSRSAAEVGPAQAQRWDRQLYYYPRRPPVLEEEAEAALAAGQLLLSSLALQWLRSPAFRDIRQGVCVGLEAANSWAERRKSTAAMSAARKVLGQVPGAPEARTSPPFVVPLPKWWEPGELRDSWTILQWKFRSDPHAVRLALDILERGADAALAQVPALRIHFLLTADRSEIEVLTGLRSQIMNYLRTTQQRRPFNIGVFGAPGSGKSFGIESIAHELAASGVKKPTTINLTQLKNEDDLKAEFRAIVAARKDGEVPVVFLDEFDRQLNGKELGWLELFLVPTWDGKFKDGASWWEFGKVIFVFAGGVAQTYEQFAEIVKAQSAGTKIADFLTRLTCKLDLPSLSYGDHEELFSNFTLIRRAIMLRSNIERFAPELLQGGTTLHIDPSVAWGFLRVNNLKFGARSIEMLVNASNLAGKTLFGRSELPPLNVLQMHVNEPEFWRRVHEGPDTDVGEPLLGFSGWPLRPSDREFTEYMRSNVARLIT